MNTRVVLSVIVPVYNGEQYIRTCLDSLCAQTLTHPFEIVVIDDGSTDRTASILQEYSQRYADFPTEYMVDFKVIYQENQGRMWARYHGIRVSRGEYIGFVDSDDWVCDEMFDRLLQVALSESADIVGCGFINVDQEGHILGYEVFQNTFEKNRHSKILPDSPPSFCNTIFRHTLFEQCGNNIVNVHRGEDLAIVPRLFYYASHVVMVQECYYYYRNIIETPHAHRTRIPVNLLKDLQSLKDLYVVAFSLADFFHDKDVAASDLVRYATKFPDLFNRYNYQHVKKYFDTHDMWCWYFSELLSLLTQYPKYYQWQCWYDVRENRVPLDCFRDVFGVLLEPQSEHHVHDMMQNLKTPSFLRQHVLLFKKRVARKLFFEFFVRVVRKIISMIRRT